MFIIFSVLILSCFNSIICLFILVFSENERNRWLNTTRISNDSGYAEVPLATVTAGQVCGDTIACLSIPDNQKFVDDL